MAELTPMKRQYQEIKEQYGDCLLFFRLGDFYEMFDEDAKIASRELDIALTTRDRTVENPEERTPMCGVPYHSCETYIARLIAKGYKVAICEQMEDPALTKGLVKRDVIRVITPGTVTESSMLEENRSNYICAVQLGVSDGGIAVCDITTGEFCCAAFDADAAGHIVNELGRFAPKEAVLSAGAADSRMITEFLSKKLDAMIERDNGGFEYMPSAARVCSRFGFASVDECGTGESAVCAAGALLAYIERTQKCDMNHINRLDVFYGGRYMELDWTTRRSLELTESLRSGEKKGSLLWVLDKTKTPMGGRMLRSWVERPLLSVVAIRRRLSAVDELVQDHVRRGEMIETLKGINDLQRLVGRTVYGTAGGRDLRAIANCAAVLPRLSGLLEGSHSQELREIAGMDLLEDVREEIDAAVCEDPPFSVREGGIMRAGWSEELDMLRNMRDNGAQMVTELEARERERTGIKKLKIGYNKVFGYFIDVPRSAGEANIPAEYIRKQTLVSNERYFTPELKELENSLLNARERINSLEYDGFIAIRNSIAAKVDRIQKTAEAVARLDALCALAETAVRNGYTMPEVDVSGTIQILDGRHPVVEQTLKDVLFVPNDTYLNQKEDTVAIVTGPNMAGKSTYMRQTALIVLMAQMGSFVPAKSATIGLVDRVFTRIGASDDLASGQSTFMVEMNEMANILKSATASSLLILDEIGRGTSTYDGMAIARAVLEYCADKKKLGAKTMFATHYHELSALEGQIGGVRNYNITARKQGGTLVFLRKIVRGAADESYGIEVAKLAGIPDSIISKAKSYLKELTANGAAIEFDRKLPEDNRISIADVGAEEVRTILATADLNSLTPLEALNLLHELQQKVRA
ncbi:MAG: DNA mismatch repair protein MutS [Oscillospiraceae bacterium]|nr:DNA mismatch repair protein MutS [Oscillospiraceae bacterium]